MLRHWAGRPGCPGTPSAAPSAARCSRGQGTGRAAQFPGLCGRDGRHRVEDLDGPAATGTATGGENEHEETGLGTWRSVYVRYGPVWDGFLLLRFGWGLDWDCIEKVAVSCECGLQVKSHHGKIATLDLDGLP